VVFSDGPFVEVGRNTSAGVWVWEAPADLDWWPLLRLATRRRRSAFGKSRRCWAVSSEATLVEEGDQRGAPTTTEVGRGGHGLVAAMTPGRFGDLPTPSARGGQAARGVSRTAPYEAGGVARGPDGPSVCNVCRPTPGAWLTTHRPPRRVGMPHPTVETPPRQSGARNKSARNKHKRGRALRLVVRRRTPASRALPLPAPGADDRGRLRLVFPTPCCHPEEGGDGGGRGVLF